jgi:hypothetical protein
MPKSESMVERHLSPIRWCFPAGKLSATLSGCREQGLVSGFNREILRGISMDVFRVEAEDGTWVLYKAHGYKPIMRGSQAELIEHVQAKAGGKGAVIRFWSDTGVRELRVGAIDEGEISAL